MKYKIRIISYTIFLAIVMTIIFITILNMFRTTKETITTQFQEQQKVLVNQSALSIKSYLEERIRAIEVLADFPASKKGEVKIFITEYERTFNKVGGFEDIVFIKADGTIIAGYPSNKFRSINIFDDIISYGDITREFQIAQKTKKSFCSTIHFTRDNKKKLYLLTPVYNHQDFLGVILGELLIDNIIPQQVEPILTGFPGYIWILLEDGTLAYHSFHNKEAGTNITKPQDKCFKCHSNFDDEREIIKKSFGSIKSKTRKNGLLSSFTTFSIPTITLKVILSTPYNNLQSSIDSAGENFLLLGGFVFLLSVASTGLFIFEIIKRRQVEKDLESQKEKEALENRYYNLVENIPDGIFIYKNGMFTLVNSAMCKIFCYEKVFFVNKYCNWDQLIVKEQLERINDIVEKLNNRIVDNAVLEVKGITKSNKLVDLVIILYFAETDNEHAIHGIVRDITEIKKLELGKKQKENLALIGEMGARIAHEIKNPLASIQTGIQLLKQKFVGKKTEEDFCERIIKEITRMDNTIKAILHFAKAYEPVFKNVQLHDSIIDVLRMNDHILKEKNITVHFLCPETITANIDEEMWKQNIWNLLNNSIQALGQNGNIYISTRLETNKIIVEFGDDAPAIPDDIREKIFEPFFSTKVQGTGLGLAITKRFVELHKGNIFVSDKKEGKIKFIIELPVEGVEK